MTYIIDGHIPLTDIWEASGRDILRTRTGLQHAGLNWADATMFALFAAYGFITHTGRQTMPMSRRTRLLPFMQIHHHTQRGDLN